MASGYSQEWSASSPWTAYVRCHYSTVFDPVTRRSTVTITPQFKSSTNYGNDYRFYNSNGTLSGAGIYGNGANLFSFGSNHGSGNYAKCGSATNTWANLNKSVTFTVQHGDDGKASFTCGIFCSVREMYSNKVIGSIGGKNSGSITITEAAATYAVSYDANGGSGAPAGQTKTYGVDLTLSAAIPTRSGYNFLGWATSASATVPDYQPGDIYSTNAALSLFAVWEMAGSAHIDDGTSLDPYTIHIDNGTSFDQYVPYIDNGTSWDVYS